MTIILDEQARQLIERIRAIQDEIRALQQAPNRERESRMVSELNALLDDVGNTYDPLDWPNGQTPQ